MKKSVKQYSNPASVRLFAMALLRLYNPAGAKQHAHQKNRKKRR
jgi:UDP-glucose 4-epimerase